MRRHFEDTSLVTDRLAPIDMQMDGRLLTCLDGFLQWANSAVVKAVGVLLPF